MGRRHDHRLPAGLAVCDHCRLFRLRVTTGDLADELGLGVPDILDRLAFHRFGKEADEITGMAVFEGHTDFAVLLHAADAWAMTGPRIDNYEGPLGSVRPHTFGRP